MRRLGEILIARGLLTPAQLDGALRSQLIVGGHLGTSLIELGFVSEVELGQVLSDTFDVRYASAEMFENVPQRILGLVSKELASRHKVVPLDASQKTLDLAMVSPNDFIALQELSFATGLRIVPLVCPEARVIQALERYYGVERPRRFVAISERMAEQSRSAAVRNAPSSAPERTSGAPAFDVTREPQTVAEHSRLHAPASHTPGGAASVPLAGSAVAVATETGPARQDAAAAASARPQPAHTDLEPLNEMLCSVDSETEIIDAIGSFLSRSGERLALFAVENDRAKCWGVSGDGFDAARTAGATFSLKEFTLFHLLTEEPYFCGPVPADSESERFFARIGIDAPVEIALFPVYREGRVEAILYADSGANTGLCHVPETYAALSRKAVLARYLADVKARIRRR